MFVASTPGAHAPMSEHSTSSHSVDHRRYQQQPPSQQSRSFGLGIRRAKTATGNSIKRLFKHGSRSDSSSSGDTSRRAATAEPIDSPSPPSSGASLHPESSHMLGPYAEHYRPPSARSTKSVRSIFSSARRITLRPSTLFRKHTLLLSDADVPESPRVAPASHTESPYGSPRMSQSLPARPASPQPPSTSASNRPRHSPMPPPPPPPMGQWMRHASNIKAERARNNPIEYTEPLSTDLDDWHSTAPSVQKLRRCPPMPVHQTQALPHPPPPPPPHQPAIASPEYSTTTYSASTTASVSASASISASVDVSTPPPAVPSAAATATATAKSPMSFSSKSLGLSLLDFGYSERAVHDSMPSPSSPESAASGPPSPSPPTSPSLSAGSLASSSPVAQVAYEQVGLGLNDSCNYYTIDPLDCTLSKSGGYFPDSYVPVISDPAPSLYLWTNVVCTLGAPEPICAAAVSGCSPIAALEESADSSPYAIRGVDDLLLELGVADTMLIADGAIPEELLLPPPTIPVLGADADVLSLREIDELIKQLGYSHAAGCIGSLDYCGWPKRKSRTLDTPAKLDIAALIGGLRCVADIVAATNVYSLAVATATSSGDEAFASPAVDPATTIAELGRAGALASLLPLASTLNIDIIVRQLGDIGIATKAVPLPQAKKLAPRLDVVGLVMELGQIIAPEFPCSTGQDEEPLLLLSDIAKWVESLGSPIDVVRAALMQTTTTATLSLAKGLMRTPEPGAAVSLAGLGGVYTSEWLVHDMEQVRMVSEQALLDTPTTFSFLEFPPIPLQPGLSALGESRMSAELAGTGMDVDEAIVDRRSRSSSMSLEHPDGTQYINRLIAALRIPPIVVSRPFLGPRRNMLFPRLC